MKKLEPDSLAGLIWDYKFLTFGLTALAAAGTILFLHDNNIITTDTKTWAIAFGALVATGGAGAIYDTITHL